MVPRRGARVGKRFYRNYMEPVVEKAVDQFLRNEPQVCGCDHCWSDTVAAALNRLAPCYVTRTAGRSHLDRRKHEFGFAMEVVKAVKAASDLVRRNPRHEQTDRLDGLHASDPADSKPQPQAASTPRTTKRYVP